MANGTNLSPVIANDLRGRVRLAVILLTCLVTMITALVWSEGHAEARSSADKVGLSNALAVFAAHTHHGREAGVPNGGSNGETREPPKTSPEKPTEKPAPEKPAPEGTPRESGTPGDVPSSFYGVNAQALWRLPASQWDGQLAKLAATGAGVVRFDAGWEWTEPNAPVNGVHRYDWTGDDQIVGALARHGLRGLPIVDYTATWTRAAGPSTPGVAAPSDPAAYASFAQAVAQRYGPGGSFWAANPALPEMAISQYEIWNEEDMDFFFHGTSASLYASLYSGARAAIHRVVPGATVIVGGLVPTFINPWLKNFIAALPEHGHEIDALAWHPYYSTAPAIYASLRALHEQLGSYGLNPPIDLTEVNSPSPLNQASVLNALTRTLPGSDCNIMGIVVHTWTPLPEDSPPQLFAIADGSGNLTEAGQAFSAGVHAAETEGVKSTEICGGSTSTAAAQSASLLASDAGHVALPHLPAKHRAKRARHHHHRRSNRS
jgi:hypothetical protein